MIPLPPGLLDRYIAAHRSILSLPMVRNAVITVGVGGGG